MTSLVDRLHALARIVDGLQGDTADRIRDRIARDLVPRTRLGDDWLVCGIVGPNNAGKSALFNGLVGRDLSPSIATGAATRRLVAAAHPDLVAALVGAEHRDRFRVRTWERPADALVGAEYPDEILLAAEPSLPERLLLIDAPDFDSIAAENRAAAEALISAADVAICVVTKHTYQNAEVVRFLEHWLAGGRPWIAVYNEAPSAAIAAQHLDKLAEDIGTPPIARFSAPWDERVAMGERPLQVAALGGGAGMAEVLGATEQRAELKRAALRASLEQLHSDVRGRIDEAERDLHALERVRDEALEHGRAVGEEVARDAMPAQPFLQAFLAVIDRRRNPLRRRWHGAVRAIAAVPRAVVRGLRGASAPAPTIEASLLDLERDALLTRVGPLVEELFRTIGRARGAREFAGAVADAIDADLARPIENILSDVEARHRVAPIDVATFQATCEELVERAIEQRGHDRDVQAFMDLATLLPMAAAAATVFLTGGFALDVAVASGGVVSTAVLERYSHWFDRGIAREARRQWRRQRGQELGQQFVEQILASAFALLIARIARERDSSAALRQWLEEEES